MSTLLCVPIIVHDVSSALARGARAAELGADLIEWRIDEFFGGGGGGTDDDAGETDHIEQILHLVAESPVPCIVTCRPTWEGGAYDGDEDARIALFERLGAADRPPRYIDVELAAYTRSANLRMKVDLAVDHPNQQRELATGLILSIHDFDGPPADLARRLLTLRQQPAAKIHKIAFRCRTVRDNLELIDILSQRNRPTIALGMGEAGLLSRVLAPKFGGFLTFATLNEQERSAPGQPTITELLNTYRFRSIGAATRLYGIVGWPVAHSRSPQIHNAGFEAIGHDGVYLPLPVAPGYESFKATILELAHRRDLHLSGLSITIPHKENLARLAREQGWPVDEPTRATGAANTLTIERDDRGEMASATVANTDALALAAILEDAGGSAAWGGGRRIAILGAGGVARAAAWAALRAGADITISNRTLERAEALAADLSEQMGLKPGRISTTGLDAAASAQPPHGPHDLYINTTSLGMEGGPGPDQSPLDFRGIALPGDGSADQRPIAIETVYTPLHTPFLKAAAAAGWRVTDGAELFIRQGIMQFREWTGQAPPTGLFERLARPTSSPPPPSA
jgi:3-dehydroquinate dehydratase / shikimate dehydrogenase